MELKSEGECKFCKKTISGRAMARHLVSCEERKKTLTEEKNQEKVFLIRASAQPFFVYFEANASSTLEKIDSFLRGLWLECCGHMSAFTIGNTRYSSDVEAGDEDKDMNIPLINVIKPSQNFIHEYDFGTTTQLDMRVVAERNGKVKNIEILARNNMPDFKCGCGEPAKEMCPECIYDDKGLLCKKCSEEHECGEEMLLPLVNSPRSGMCGYTGND